MGLMDKLKGELVDIIEWIDDSRSTLAWRFPRYQNEIKNGAALIVREGQKAVFVYRGQLADQFDPGHYELKSENLPILSTLQGWKYGFDSPFRSEVYFINTRPVTDIKWGTPNPITIRDPDFRMVPVRANGTVVLRIVDTGIFLKEVIGTDSAVEADEIAVLLRQVIATAFSEMVLTTGLGAIDLQTRQVELAGKLREFVQEKVDDEFGLSIMETTLQISLPEEITQALTRGAAKAGETSNYIETVNLNKLQQANAADAILAAANNPGGSAMGDMMQMGMGMAMANQMAGQMGNAFGGQQATPPPMPSQAMYHVDQNGHPGGPYSVAQIQQGVAAGQVTAQTLVWTNGMAAWTPAGQVPALASLFAAPPPIPGAGTPPPMPPAPPAPPAAE